MHVPQHILRLWEKYELPEYKRHHCHLVSRVAGYFCDQIQHISKQLVAPQRLTPNKQLLIEASLLHDIDKRVKKKNNEGHPDSAVRILKEEGMNDVAEVVRTHAVHCALETASMPITLEQKLLYVADKMVKQDIISLDERFALWFKERLPEEVADVLQASYPRAKELEHEILSFIKKTPQEVASEVGESI